VPVFDVLSEIGALWKLVGVLVVLVLALLFNKPIRAILDRGFRLRHRNTEFEAHPPQALTTNVGVEETESERDEDRTHDAETPVALAETKTSEENARVDESEPTMGAVFSLVIDGELGRARDVFDAVQAAEKGEATRIQNEANFAAARARWGNDQTALAELVSITETHPDLASLAGMVYEDAGYFDKALSAFDAAGEAAPDDGFFTGATMGAARSLRALGRPKDAQARISSALNRVTDSENRASLYVEASNLYEKEGDWLSRAVSLEKALEIRPNDVSLRFRAGYSYSQANQEDLAVIHYRAALVGKPDDDASRNNIGVAYERLGMRSKAVAAYKRAADGNTLAAANLGQRLTDAGFLDDARTTLLKAARDKEPHPNVAKATARLDEVAEEEERVGSEVLERGRLKEGFFRDYGDGLLVESPTPDIREGKWVAGGIEAEVTFSETAKSLTVKWTDAEGTHTCQGPLINRSVAFDEHLDAPSPKTRRAFGVLTPAGDRLTLLLGDLNAERDLRLAPAAPTVPPGAPPVPAE
jgi:tetratricopeptide (TPR) repeat protein